jgi:carboxymethylenebutenolidase
MGAPPIATLSALRPLLKNGIRHSRMHCRILVVSLSLLAVFGCKDDEPKPVVTTPSSAVETPTPKPVPSQVEERPSALTGRLSEQDFKALHELKGEAAPKPRGTMVALPSFKGYLTLPKNATPPLPAVVVIHEWWGLNEHIKHWADRLTEDGYAALAVDLYDGRVATDPDAAMDLMKKVDDEDARKKLLEAFAFLGTDPRVKADRRASIGWCFGGKWSLELALAAPTLTAAVVYYGHVETNPERLASLESPLLAIFGEKDESIDAKYVDRFRFGLEQAGDKNAKIVTYDADHAFANPSSARYDFGAAEKAWAETRGFLGKYLKGAGADL